MTAVADWVKRLEVLVASRDKSTQTIDARPHYRRLLVPGFEPLGLEGIVRLIPNVVIGAESGWPGRLPAGMSVLEWWDVSERAEDLASDTIAREIASVLTLVTSRRIEVAAEQTVALPAGPTLFIPIGQAPDRSLYAPVDEADIRHAFEAALSRLVTAPEEAQTALGSAIRLHHAACVLMEEDLTTAYVLLVAGIEALAQAFFVSAPHWEDWQHYQAWDALLADLDLSAEVQTVSGNRCSLITTSGFDRRSARTPQR